MTEPLDPEEAEFRELINARIKKFEATREAVFSKEWATPNFGRPCYQVSPHDNHWYILIILPEMPTKIITYPVPYATEAEAWLECWEIFGKKEPTSLRSEDNKKNKETPSVCGASERSEE